MTKDYILSEIKRTAALNGNVPLGRDRFEGETGVKQTDWYGKYWSRWGDALREAGYAPNAWQAAYPEDHLLAKFVALIRELGRFPVGGDLRMRSRQYPSFPSHTTFGRFGSKAQLVARVVTYCAGRPEFEDVLAICSAVRPPADAANFDDEGDDRDPAIGHVYFLRFGRHYKIGRTNALGRRERELAIQLPDRARTVHAIRTDDPAGIEEYWHERFASKRGNGEWFDLDAADVNAFKRRKFM